MQDRFCPVLEPEFRCCIPPFSFYRFIEKYWPSNEENRTLHRIFSLMRKMKAQTLVIEDLANKGELAEEARAIETRCGGTVEFKAWRFTFFAGAVTRESLPYTNDIDYIGYVVFVSARLPDRSYSRYVYESVTVEPSFKNASIGDFGCGLPGHYVHCVRRYSGWVAGRRFTLSGSFFSQQNGLTHVCAHAALRWLLNNLPERAEKIISYEDINKVLQIDHDSYKIGQYGGDIRAVGLPMDQLLKVIEEFGYKHLDVDLEDPVGQALPYWRFVYSVIESGYPVLVFFRTEHARHVICVIGHTFNSDIWDAEAKLAYSGAPRAEYLSTACWIDHFIIHDDNYGMYFCMPAKALSPQASENDLFRVTGAVGIVPEKIDLGPLEAEFLASLIFQAIHEAPFEECYWLRTLRREERAFVKWPVLRTLLTSKAAYQQHLLEIEDVEGNSLTKEELRTIIRDEMPEHFWMTEITLTDIYTANKRKLGEILLKPSEPSNAREDNIDIFTKKLFSSCLAIRLPGRIIIPKVEKNRILLSLRETNLTGHVDLLRMGRPTPPFEW